MNSDPRQNRVATTDPHQPAARLAAIVFDRDEDPDPPLSAFIEAARARGARIAGLVQEHARRDAACALNAIRVRDLVTGETMQVMQDLGRDAIGCRVDGAAIAAVALWLEAARTDGPDLMVVNRFGRLESEGGGLLGEIGQAFSDGLPLIICVPKRNLESWDAFASGLDVKLEPTLAAIEAWWAAVSAAPSGDAAAA